LIAIRIARSAPSSAAATGVSSHVGCDALIPIHPGAATYYNGNQQSFFDKYDDKLYYGSLLLGSLISIVVAAWRLPAPGIAKHARAAL
jgi:hypothetical protein